jgi:hypothetical protein
MRVSPFLGVAVLSLFFLSGVSEAAAPLLWQERYYFDALIQARDRRSRSESDPNLIPVLRSIAGEVLQQAANVKQIDVYAKAQQGSLRYAFSQNNADSSLKIIGINLSTLAQGAIQVKNNLAYLMVRCRLASSQVLPDPQIYQNSLLVLTEVRRLQFALNELYTDALESEKLIKPHADILPASFQYQSSSFMRTLAHVQRSVFALYNSGYDLALRSR